MDEEQFVRDVVDRSEWWIGLITRQTIVDQLAHTVAVNGITRGRLSAFDETEWNDLATDAFAIDDEWIRRAVIQVTAP